MNSTPDDRQGHDRAAICPPAAARRCADGAGDDVLAFDLRWAGEPTGRSTRRAAFADAEAASGRADRRGPAPVGVRGPRRVQSSLIGVVSG